MVESWTRSTRSTKRSSQRIKKSLYRQVPLLYVRNFDPFLVSYVTHAAFQGIFKRFPLPAPRYRPRPRSSGPPNKLTLRCVTDCVIRAYGFVLLIVDLFNNSGFNDTRTIAKS